MVQFDIYCDSGANIPYEIVKERGINIIPYSYNVGGEEFSCYGQGNNFHEIAKKFYEDMRSGVEFKTSLIGMQKIIDAVTPSLENGRDVLMTFIAAGISGSFNQAREAVKVLSEKYPDRKIIACDSVNASMGEGLLVLRACDLRDMGESIEACAEWLESNKYNLNSYLTVGDLKYLKKGGRISATLAIAGTLLNIKPILKANGEDIAQIVFHSKERGRKRALTALAENFTANVVDPENQTVAICHCDCEDDAKALAEMVKERGAKDIIIEYYDLCSGAHIGPDTVALFFYGKDRKTGIVPKKGFFSKFRKHAKEST